MTLQGEQIPKTQRSDWVDGLPPDEAWLKDRNEKMETPVDSRGLVDITGVVRAITSYVHPSYLYYDNPSVHHLNWPHRRYIDVQEQTSGKVPALDFCELPSQKILMPRMPHTIGHVVLLPPPMPDVEVMRHSIEAWRVAHSLFDSADKIRRLAARFSIELCKDNSKQRLDILREYEQEQYERYFKCAIQQIDKLDSVPPEHWVVDPLDDPRAVYQKVGSIVGRSYRRINGQIKHTRRGRRVRLGDTSLPNAA